VVCFHQDLNRCENKGLRGGPGVRKNPRFVGAGTAMPAYGKQAHLLRRKAKKGTAMPFPYICAEPDGDKGGVGCHEDGDCRSW